MPDQTFIDIPLLVIMGPTASGKSDLALRLAQDLDGEIVSCDSMQIYRGLDIGTAKPTEKESERVPHHLIDVADIHERIDVFQFVAMAEDRIRDIYERGRTPVLAGGTGMYIRSLLYGLDPLPADETTRKRLELDFGEDRDFNRLREHMRRSNPLDYERWKNHHRKLLRALEVFTLTGRSITELQKTWRQAPRFPVSAWCLHWDREELKERIRERTAKMLEQGWIEETKALLDQGLLASPTAHQALGYKIIKRYLDGEIDLDATRSLIATRTWQFARRQITWFKRQHPEAKILPMPLDERTYKQLIGIFIWI